MCSFLSDLAMVLAGADEIPSLPNDKLICCFDEGEPIGRPVDRKTFLLVARLQTIIARQKEKMTEGDEETPPIEEMGEALQLRMDYAHRIDMLERLIVEAVREAVPAESEIYDFTYFAHVSTQIFRRKGGGFLPG